MYVSTAYVAVPEMAATSREDEGHYLCGRKGNLA
jgi:hypothetical protein